MYTHLSLSVGSFNKTTPTPQKHPFDGFWENIFTEFFVVKTEGFQFKKRFYVGSFQCNSTLLVVSGHPNRPTWLRYICMLNFLTISFFSFELWTFTVKTHTDRFSKNYILEERNFIVNFCLFWCLEPISKVCHTSL